jgi:hypothetical protein
VVVVDKVNGRVVELRLDVVESLGASAEAAGSDLAHSSQAPSAPPLLSQSPLAWQLTRTQQLKYPYGIESFGWNTSSAHALATYKSKR